MDKKIISIPLAMLLLAFMFIAVHECGHFYTARQAGYEASIHFFSSPNTMENNSFFLKGIAYTKYTPINNENKEVIERKIILGGMWFELILLGIIATIIFIVSLKRGDLLLIILVGIMVAVVWSLVISWNIFHIITGTDLYYILGG